MTHPNPDFSKRRLNENDVHRRPNRVPRRSHGGIAHTLRRTWRKAQHTIGPWLASRPSIRKLVLIGTGCGLTFAVLYTLFLWITLPSLDAGNLLAVQSTTITDRNGVELYRLHGEEDRTIVEGEKIPLHLKQAIISIEDERYYERDCIDARALLRAVFFMGRAGGGSTITRQLARNALKLKRDHVINRKLKELILGCQLESQYSKDELLNMYLNWIPFGQNAYGVEQASKLYFGTTTEQLTLAQSVILASLPQRPTYLSPYGRNVHTRVGTDVKESVLSGTIASAEDIPGESIRIGLIGSAIGSGSTVVYVGGRTDQVLENMQEQGYINDEEKQQAIDDLQVIEFQPSRDSIRAPHFVLWIREQVEEMFADTAEQGILEMGGWTIETTLDWELQQIAEDVITERREDIANRFGARNAALLSIDPTTQEIVAYVGNSNFLDEDYGGKIDMIHVPRQPGSSFKPIAYAAAFKEGINPATVLWDVPTKVGDDEPQNFDSKFMGPMPVRNALGASRNIPAAKSYFLAGGEEPILELAASLGAPTPQQFKEQRQQEDIFEYGWPLALGAAETPLSEMTTVYSTFANGGLHTPLISIRKITDQQGNVLPIPGQDSTKRRALDARIAYQITSILSDELARPGEFWRNQLSVPGFQSAAKTGTSNKCLEYTAQQTCRLRKADNAWTIGYTPNLVTGVWVGNADNAAMYDKAGGLNTASPIWKDYMTQAHRILATPQTSFSQPAGLVTAQVSKLSGQLPTDCTPIDLRQSDVFLSERAPRAEDSACLLVNVDRVTGLLPSDTCPPEALEEQPFLIARSIRPETYGKWEIAVQDWMNKQMELWNATDSHSGSLLPLPAPPSAKCDPSLTPGRLHKPKLTVLFPQDGGIANYPTFQPKLRIEIASGSSIRQVVYKIDGRTVKETFSGSLASSIRVPRSIQKSGPHSLSIEVTDTYYNTVSRIVSLRFEEDTHAPTVSLTSPQDGLRIHRGTNITLRATADDRDGGVKHVQFYLGPTLLTTKPAPPYELTYTVDEPVGSYRLEAVVTDFAGNTDRDRREMFVVPDGFSLDTPVQASSAISNSNQGSNTPQAGPSFIAPTEDLTLTKDDTIDIMMNTPSMDDLDLIALRITVEHKETRDIEQLLRLSSGKGTYTRSWSPRTTGTYLLRIVTQNRQREDATWEERIITVE